VTASSQQEHHEVVIIGCGMAGLAAGIRLAMYDRDVLILERHNAPGGLNSFYSIAGRKFDVGLHALTNFTGPERKGTPLSRIFRQLRIPRDQWQLCPQVGSRIATPHAELRFTNDFNVLESEVARAFPHAIDGFRRLRAEVLACRAYDGERDARSARAILRATLNEPALEEMLLVPILYYGGPREHDIDFDAFVVLWHSLFEEGFSRPPEGIRVIMRSLLQRYRELGGKRRMKCGVRRILSGSGRATALELDDGAVITADHVISTVGLVETTRLCAPAGAASTVGEDPRVGRLSFVETITVLDTPPAELGARDTIVFFNHGERFEYRRPDALVDPRSGVICVPNNYAYPDDAEGAPDEGVLRITALANHDCWAQLDEAAYRAAKETHYRELQESALAFIPGLDFARLQRSTRFIDMFTPLTITRFTGHLGGAVYGASVKVPDGNTELCNLYIAGTDQGYLGIVGAMLSGISIANRRILA